MNGGERIASVLRSHGVEFLFTLCGGHISPILKGAKDVGIRVIDVRHEATAVFAADAVARLTGIPGVAAVTAYCASDRAASWKHVGSRCSFWLSSFSTRCCWQWSTMT